MLNILVGAGGDERSAMLLRAVDEMVRGRGNCPVHKLQLDVAPADKVPLVVRVCSSWLSLLQSCLLAANSMWI